MKTKIEIPAEEIQFHPLSFADPSGRVFWWKEKLYRGIVPEKAALFQQLFDQGIARRLSEKGLAVESTLTEFFTPQYPLILQHHIVPFVSYPFEWSPNMLKAAALTVIDLEIELSKNNLTLIDVQPWNVLFEGCRPFYVDYGSIASPLEGTLWAPYNVFCSFYLYPLYLSSQHLGRAARWLLHDHELGVLPSEFQAFARSRTRHTSIRTRLLEASRHYLPRVKKRIPNKWIPVARNIAQSVRKSKFASGGTSTQSRIAFLQSLRKEVESIVLSHPQTEWGNYGDDFPSLSPSEDWTAKHRGVYQVLTRVRPSSVLDIGGNRGWFAQLATSLGAQSITFDIDEPSVSRLFQEIRDKNLSILPLVMDFQNPSPAAGIAYQWLKPATERFRCELILALAIVHHLVFKSHLKFEQIVEGLASFCDKYLLVEFIPREDQHVSQWWNSTYSWYSLEEFQTELSKHFSSITILPSHPNPRVLLLCER